MAPFPSPSSAPEPRSTRQRRALRLRAKVPGIVHASIDTLDTVHGPRSIVLVRVGNTDEVGALSPRDGETIAEAARAALDERLPVVVELSSSGADIREGLAALHGWGQAARALTACSGVVPTVFAVDGPAVSGPGAAARHRRPRGDDRRSPTPS